MILSLFTKKPDPAPVHAAYTAIVAQSRQPRFYAEWGVPDTVTGRFDMISLHLSLLFRRLRQEGPAARDFSQALFDLFFKDMDRSLREMGVGDLSVGKKIQKMGALFYGLLAKVSEALDRQDGAGLEEVLRRNIYADMEPAHAGLLAAYLMAQAGSLESQPVASITAGTIVFGAN